MTNIKKIAALIPNHIHHVRQYLLIVGITSLLGACCGIPDGLTDHERRVKNMDSLVGKHVTDVYAMIPYKYQKNPSKYFEERLVPTDKRIALYVIVDYKGEPAYRHVYPPRPACATVEFISIRTLKILGWEYAPGSDPEQCISFNKCNY